VGQAGRRQDRVNVRRPGVKVPSVRLTLSAPRAHAQLCCGAVIRARPVRWKGGAPQMADLAYAVLLIAGFLVLVLTLRGLEKL
jgi:hypothetical protein